MSVNMIIGYKSNDGKVKAVDSRTDGGINEKQLFYKYYRTKERVEALINDGGGKSSLGILISQDEFNINSPLYNKEVTMLPFHIGFDDKNFYDYISHYYSEKQEKFLRFNPVEYSSEEEFFEAAKEYGFYDHLIYLFDSKTRQWTQGVKKKDIRISMLEDVDRLYEDDSEEKAIEKTKLIKDLAAIDNFIAARENMNTLYIKSDNNELLYDPELSFKYNEFVRFAESKGIKVTGCYCEPAPLNKTLK